MYLFHGAPGPGEIASLVAIILLKYINVKSCLAFSQHCFFLLAEREKGNGTIKKRNSLFNIFFKVSAISRMPGINSGAKSSDNDIQIFIRDYIR